MNQRLRVNPTACTGHGLCAELLPERVTLDEWGYPVISADPVPAQLARAARRAVTDCPALALMLVTDRQALTETGWSETTRGALTPHSPAWHALEISAIGDLTKPGPQCHPVRAGRPAPRRLGYPCSGRRRRAGLMPSALRYEGWDVETAADGLSAVRAGREFRPDAAVPDVMLPDFGGLEVLRRLRAEPPAVCVLFLTARESVEGRIAGITAPSLAARQAPGRMIIRKKPRSCGNPYTTRAASAFLPRSRFRSSDWPDRHECSLRDVIRAA